MRSRAQRCLGSWRVSQHFSRAQARGLPIFAPMATTSKRTTPRK